MIDFYENFGVECIQKDKNKRIYGEAKSTGKHIIMIVFPVFSGIDIILYNCFEKYKKNSGEIKLSKQNFYCVSYYAEGIYESEIKKNKFRYALPGSIDIVKNYDHSSKAEIKSDTMQGFSIMLFPDLINREEIDFLLTAFDMNIEHVMQYLDKFTDAGSISPDMRLLHIAYELNGYLMEENLGMVRLKVVEFFNSIIADGFKLISSDKRFSKEQINKTRAIQEKMLYNMTKHSTIQSLCKEFRISETTFKECFKAIYQHTPYEFLRNARMNKAAELLRNNNCTISKISQKLGYENPSNFTRTFKAVFGVGPKEYRENV